MSSFLAVAEETLRRCWRAPDKSVTVVDHNPVSFDLAKRFFGMPKEIFCIVEDFKEYLAAETRSFDAIAIDVGGPGFCYEEQFDPATCHSITARLNPGGRAMLKCLSRPISTRRLT